jgi:hypothetical protein
MAVRHKNHDLLLRNGRWYINKRLPDVGGFLRKSLRTSDIVEARAKRDQFIKKWDSVAAAAENHKTLVYMRKRYLSAFDPDEQALIEDDIIDESEELASKLGVWELIKSPVTSREQSETEKKPIRFWETATGRLTPFAQLAPTWIKSIENKKTQYDYKRAITLLGRNFVAAEEITWEKARAYLRHIQEETSVSDATIRKWVSGYVSFWNFYDKDPAVWRNLRLSKAHTIDKRSWTRIELLELHAELFRRDHWLQHAVWIAAHTGARLGAICGLTYHPEDLTITMPAQKREAHDRLIPAHPAILESLEYWSHHRRSKSSVSGRFGEFKKELGYGIETDFHSIRRTFCTELENLGCPEAVTADIVGHKKQTMTYGLYSGGSSIELMREWIERLSY